MAARYATDTFVMQLPSGSNILVQKGSTRDSLETAVTANPGAFSVTAPVAGKDVDGKTAARLAAYPRGTEVT